MLGFKLSVEKSQAVFYKKQSVTMMSILGLIKDPKNLRLQNQ